MELKNWGRQPRRTNKKIFSWPLQTTVTVKIHVTVIGNACTFGYMFMISPPGQWEVH